MIAARIEVTKEVKIAKLLGEPVRSFLESAQRTVHGTTAEPGVVPIDSGMLRNMMAEGAGGWDMDSSPVPQWAKVGVAQGEVHDYGLRLHNESRYHYLRGPAAGSETAGWMERGADAAWADISGDGIQALAKDIEAAWRG